uniref:SDR family oxidoreductase n=1 Tax=Mycolicibacterium obuense TaxID=1807 RepID=UPI003F58846F
MRILLTGASSGLGAEMARQFAARGHDLVLTARRVDRLQSLRAEIEAKHPLRTVEVSALDVLDNTAVHTVFQQHAPLDRIIINAGLGGGKPVGTGHAEHNLRIATTDFVAAISQAEAAMDLFRSTGRGHLVFISSFSAIRGLRGGPAVYSAAKRGIAHLAEGLRSETLRTDITITTVYPGYIRSEMTAHQSNAPFTVDTEPGVRVMVAGIEKQRASVFAPSWPWAPLSLLFRLAPLPLLHRLTPPSHGD